MSVRNALLTLLAKGPQHGYQLKTEFDSATGAAWPLNFGQVYTTLQRLEKAGLVVPAGDEDRTVYSITDSGLNEVETWMSSPVSRPLAERDELSMKILLALSTGFTDPDAIVDRQRRATTETLQSVASLKVEAEQHLATDQGSDTDDATAPSGLAWLLHLDRMAMMAETEIRWLDLVEDRLSAQPTPDEAAADTTASPPNQSEAGDHAARP